MTVFTGNDSDEIFNSDTDSIDQVDGGGGIDKWSGSYTAPVIFTYDGHSAQFSNGTTLANIERLNYISQASADGDSYTITGGTVLLDGGPGRNTLIIDYTGKTLDSAGRNYVHADPNAPPGEHRLLVLVQGTEDRIGADLITDVRIKLTEHDDHYEFGSDASMTDQIDTTTFIDGGDGEDTLTLVGVGAQPTLEHDVYGNYIFTGGQLGYNFSTVTFTNFEHVVYNGTTYDLAPLTPFTFTEGVDVAQGTDVDELFRALGGNDRLFGNGGDDVIDGGAGNDLIDGGDGNDTASYETATAGAHVSLAKTGAQKTIGWGIDTLVSIENLVGSAFRDVLTGNDGANLLDGGGENDRLSGGGGNDHLLGRDGNDILDGGTGADFMDGGFGDDQYYVDDAGDQVVESDAFGGLDLVFSSIAYALGDNIENLTLMGSDAIKGTGNALDNLIRGNAGDNVLDGGAGDDTLVGGAGADTFVLNVLDPRMKGDVIKDFVSGTDHIALSRTVFTGLSIFGVAIDAGELTYGTKAATATDRLIYDEHSGNLWYDRDGVGGASQIKIATLSTHPHIEASDFVLI